MTTKPEFWMGENPFAFDDARVAQLYRHRPPYPVKAFDVLAGLVLGPRVVLDAGTGTGAIARHLASRVDRVDALDPAAHMIVEGKQLEHGDDPRIRWILGNAETGPLFGPYGLITTGQSLHWMDWEVVLPRFAGALAPGARLAIVDDPEAPQPWSDELRPILIRHSIHRGKWHQFELIGELVRLGLFAIEGELTLEAEPIEQPLEEYIASFHATSSLARHRIGDDEADAFDREVKELLAAHPTVTRRVAARIVWGRPVPA